MEDDLYQLFLGKRSETYRSKQKISLRNEDGRSSLGLLNRSRKESLQKIGDSRKPAATNQEILAKCTPKEQWNFEKGEDSDELSNKISKEKANGDPKSSNKLLKGADFEFEDCERKRRPAILRFKYFDLNNNYNWREFDEMENYEKYGFIPIMGQSALITSVEDTSVDHRAEPNRSSVRSEDDDEVEILDEHQVRLVRRLLASRI